MHTAHLWVHTLYSVSFQIQESYFKNYTTICLHFYILEQVAYKTKYFKTVRKFWVGCDHYLDPSLFQWCKESIFVTVTVGNPFFSSISGVCGLMWENIFFCLEVMLKNVFSTLAGIIKGSTVFMVPFCCDWTISIDTGEKAHNNLLHISMIM